MKKQKNKLSLFTVLTIVMISINSYGQGIYFCLGSGYGFSAFPQLITNTWTENENGNTSQSTDNPVFGSYSNGFNFNAIIGYDFSKHGYNFSKHFSTEIGISFINGSTYESTGDWTIHATQSNPTTSNVLIKNKLQASIWRIAPTIKWYTETTTFTPYIKIGFIIGLGGKIKVDYDRTDTWTDSLNITSKETTNTSRSYTKGFSFGLSSALGVDYFLSKQFGLYVEFNFTGQSWAPEHSEYIKYLNNDKDILNSLPINERYANYSNKGIFNSPTDHTQPSEYEKEYYPFSDWGFKIGVKYNFGG
ncbi:MAG: hypothetical protein WCL14_05230 [Bacteroidota bacterium]